MSQRARSGTEPLESTPTCTSADSASPSDAVYVLSADGQPIATPLSRGPWNPGAQHGGAAAGLIAWALERHPDATGHQFTRITIDLIRAVPVAPIDVQVEKVAGRSSARWEVTLSAGSTVCATAHAVSQPAARDAAPATDHRPALPFDTAGPAIRIPGMPEGPSFHYTAVESHLAAGTVAEPGPATAWVRLLNPLVAGHETTPLMRVLAAADFGHGISWELPFSDYTWANADLSVHLLRPARGEWIGLDARTTIDQTGQGLTRTELCDGEGHIGTALAGLVIRPASKPTTADHHTKPVRT